MREVMIFQLDTVRDTLRLKERLEEIAPQQVPFGLFGVAVFDQVIKIIYECMDIGYDDLTKVRVKYSQLTTLEYWLDTLLMSKKTNNWVDKELMTVEFKEIVESIIRTLWPQLYAMLEFYYPQKVSSITSATFKGTNLFLVANFTRKV